MKKTLVRIGANFFVKKFFDYESPFLKGVVFCWGRFYFTNKSIGDINFALNLMLASTTHYFCWLAAQGMLVLCTGTAFCAPPLPSVYPRTWRVYLYLYMDVVYCCKAMEDAPPSLLTHSRVFTGKNSEKILWKFFAKFFFFSKIRKNCQFFLKSTDFYEFWRKRQILRKNFLTFFHSVVTVTLQ